MTPLPPLPPRSLTLDKLAGRRGEKLLFAGVNLKLGPCMIAELRGPNGAGKTTLLLIVAGVVRPASGRVVIEGGDADARPETDIGWLGHRAAVKPRLTVMENLQFWAALNGRRPESERSAGRGSDAVDAALDRVGLAPIAGLDAGYLSAGQTRRLALARLILGDRPVWLLDEPMAALDAAGERLVAGLIDTHLDRGGLVLAATHHGLGLGHPVQTVELGAQAVSA